MDNDRILEINIENEMKQGYIDYSMSVIVSRALPDVRDGFKPVHRRVLFGMQKLHNFSNQAHKKSARIVGEVLGKSHKGTVVSDVATLAHILIEEYLTAVIPCADFGRADHIRLSYAISMEQIAKGLDRIQSFLEALE